MAFKPKKVDFSSAKFLWSMVVVASLLAELGWAFPSTVSQDEDAFASYPQRNTTQVQLTLGADILPSSARPASALPALRQRRQADNCMSRHLYNTRHRLMVAVSSTTVEAVPLTSGSGGDLQLTTSVEVIGGGGLGLVRIKFGDNLYLATNDRNRTVIYSDTSNGNVVANNRTLWCQRTINDTDHRNHQQYLPYVTSINNCNAGSCLAVKDGDGGYRVGPSSRCGLNTHFLTWCRQA